MMSDFMADDVCLREIARGAEGGVVSARRVVVTGLGPVTPIGLGAANFWTALLEKKSGVKRLAAFDPSPFPAQLGAEIAGLLVSDAVPNTYNLNSVDQIALDDDVALLAKLISLSIPSTTWVVKHTPPGMTMHAACGSTSSRAPPRSFAAKSACSRTP